MLAVFSWLVVVSLVLCGSSELDESVQDVRHESGLWSSTTGGGGPRLHQAFRIFPSYLRTCVKTTEWHTAYRHDK
jgi:hypothetical protein